MRVLAITKIFPNAAEPLSAPFNRQQFGALRQLCDLDVMATIPWFPGAGWLSKWSSAGKLARVPRRETIAGIDVSHPRTLFFPKLAHATWGPLYAASIAPLLAPYRGKVDVDLAPLDLIDSSGVAALVKLYKGVRSAGGRIAISGARDQPLAIFKLLRMDKVFDL